MPPQGQECECQEFDQVVALVKQETTYSNDSVPTPTEAVIFTGRPTVAIKGNDIERNLTQPYWGNSMHQTTDKFVTLTGEVEVAGPGAAGSLPGAAALLRACGNAETVDAGVDVQYDPASSGIPSVSAYFHQDKDLWKIAGMRGNAKLMMSAGQFAKWAFAMTGLFTIPENNASLPTLLPASDAEPLILNYENTPTGTFFGENVDINNFEFDQGNVISEMNKPGCYAVQIKGRAPTGTITICSPLITAQNVRDLANRYETGAIAVEHGVNAGEIMRVDLSKVQLNLAGITDIDLGENEKGLQIPFKVLPTSGDDDYKITYK